MKLATVRTILSPLEKTDFKEILQMYQEPDTAKYIAPLRNKTPQELHLFLEGKVVSNTREVGFWVVRMKETNEFIGTANLNLFQAKSFIHVGCHLSNKHWGKGFGFEVMNRLKHFGIQERKLNAVHGIVEEGHVVSQALMHKMGFQLIEQLESDAVLNVYRFDAAQLQS